MIKASFELTSDEREILADESAGPITKKIIDMGMSSVAQYRLSVGCSDDLYLAIFMIGYDYYGFGYWTSIYYPCGCDMAPDSFPVFEVKKDESGNWVHKDGKPIDSSNVFGEKEAA